MHRIILYFLLCMLPLGASSQTNEQFYSDLRQAWQAESVKSLGVMLDDEVDFSVEGKEGRLSRRQLEGELNHFFTGSKPSNFTLKHKGSSQDGQIYLVGRLETAAGESYKIVCRAKAVQSSFRIFQLDVDLGD